MTDQPTKPVTFAFRMTLEDQAELDRAANAAGMSRGVYAHWRVFAPQNPPPRSRGKFPVKDHQAISTVIAKLGQSRIANNLNQLTKAVNSGSLILTPEVIDDLRETRVHIAEIRVLLLAALGLSDGAP